MKKSVFRSLSVGLLIAACMVMILGTVHASLQTDFKQPPDSTRPWVYWFWPNGYVTKEGITADLEAMAKVGIGGVLIMDVNEFTQVPDNLVPPPGPVDLLSPKWREMFKHAVNEASRLGLQINMNNGAAWSGSGGPWIKPEQSQKVVTFKEITVEGPKRLDEVIPQPDSKLGFYRDIAVLAYPVPEKEGKIVDIEEKGASLFTFFTNLSPAAVKETAAGDQAIDPRKIINITNRMKPDGRITLDIPAGKWIIARYGYTSQDRRTFPAGKSGEGLECDKLSQEGIQAQFDNMLRPLIEDNKQNIGKTFVSTHIDSWEVSCQNWTENMREEFKKRRGYDMIPFLPVLASRYVGSAEVTERFLWDLRITISELMTDYYSGGLADLAHKNGLKLSIESYPNPNDEMTFGAPADDPQCEFWTTDSLASLYCVKEMASMAHVYGKETVGAEAFTSVNTERFQQHPGSMKPFGDLAFCTGVNKMIIHRYAHQPWMNVKPGMSMGFWGVHYERTQTWWNQATAFNKYLSRCQYMLRQGKFHADIVSLRPEWSPLTINERRLRGYDYDECTPELVMKSMTVKNGWLCLPSGMRYRLMMLPDYKTMTPELLSKVRDLVRQGATVVGNRPERSPSLRNYPRCDAELKQIADDLWGNCDGKTVTARKYGNGLIMCGVDPTQYLKSKGIGPDFFCERPLARIHRTVGDKDVYFVSNQQAFSVKPTVRFRVTGKQPQLWWPDSGRIEPAPVYAVKNGYTEIVLPLEKYGSVFVVFEPSAQKLDSIVEIRKNDKSQALLVKQQKPNIVIEKAIYGWTAGNKTIDARERIQRLVDSGETSFRVLSISYGNDPAFFLPKDLDLTWSVDGKQFTKKLADVDIIDLTNPAPNAIPNVELQGETGGAKILASEPGEYTVVKSSGKKVTLAVPTLPQRVDISGPWNVSFPPNLGAPAGITLDKLESLSNNTNQGVKYFSGTATYHTSFDVSGSVLSKADEWYLDLGRVEVIAEVKLNGQNLGIWWKQPFNAAVSKYLKPGKNDLEVKVTNQWANRMIGDDLLPADVQYNDLKDDLFANGTAKAWPEFLTKGTPRTSGRITFCNYKLWSKNDKPLDSGLIGPVQLVPFKTFTVK